MSVEIREVDPADTTALRAWWEAARASIEHDRAFPAWAAWSTVLTRTQHPDPRNPVVRLAALERGRVVATSMIGLPPDANDHMAFVDPTVLPSERGRGHGSALVAAGERTALGLGRTTVLTELHLPADADLDRHPTVAFARRHGYQVAGDEQIKVADLVATEAAWPGLAAYAAERQGDYRLEWWSDPMPEERIEAICVLFGRFLGEIPLGDMDLRPQPWTAARLREAEQQRIRTGRRQLTVAAVAPDGTTVGYSNVRVDDGTPERAAIDSTLVLPEHRGHRLGLALKVRLHQLLRERFPGATHVVTGNAAVNGSMNNVNDRLGYVVVEQCLEMQKVLQPAGPPS